MEDKELEYQEPHGGEHPKATASLRIVWFVILLTPGLLALGFLPPLLMDLTLLAALGFTFYSALHEEAADISDSTPELSDDETDIEVPLCPGCLEEYPEATAFCPKCLCPVGAYVTLDPIQRYWAISYMVIHGISRPPLSIVFSCVFVFFLFARGLALGSLFYLSIFHVLEIETLWMSARVIISVIALVVGTACFLLYMRVVYITLRNRDAEPYDRDDYE